MQPISHDSKDILDQTQEILLVKWLSYAGSTADIQK